MSEFREFQSTLHQERPERALLVSAVQPHIQPHIQPPSNRRARTRVALSLVAVVLMAFAPAGSLLAESASDAREVHAFTLENQPASEALVLVRRLLSDDGTVELQPRENTVVVRDRRSVLDRLTPLIEAFDHPKIDLRFEIHLLRAGGEAGEAPPSEVVEKLERYLRYDAYHVLGSAGVTSREGGRVTYDLGDDYQVSFRPGTMVAGRSLKLHDFQITKRSPRLVAANANKSRQPQPEQLIQTNLNLWREKQFIMVLSQDAGSEEELMIAIKFRPDPAAGESRSE